MVYSIIKVLLLVSIATILCFVATTGVDYYISNFSSSQEKIFIMHNEHRAKTSTGSLSLDSGLSSFAKKHANWMLSRNNLIHSNQDFKGKYKGENIAYSSTDSPEVVFKKWINSRGHRSNIEFILYSKIGIGVSGNSRDGYYYCVVFSD
jgi:uncharacterized protein YkwD